MGKRPPLILFLCGALVVLIVFFLKTKPLLPSRKEGGGGADPVAGQMAPSGQQSPASVSHAVWKRPRHVPNEMKVTDNPELAEPEPALIRMSPDRSTLYANWRVIDADSLRLIGEDGLLNLLVCLKVPREEIKELINAFVNKDVIVEFSTGPALNLGKMSPYGVGVGEFQGFVFIYESKARAEQMLESLKKGRSVITNGTP